MGLKKKKIIFERLNIQSRSNNRGLHNPPFAEIAAAGYLSFSGLFS
jgi:hypothetical protein